MKKLLKSHYIYVFHHIDINLVHQIKCYFIPTFYLSNIHIRNKFYILSKCSTAQFLLKKITAHIKQEMSLSGSSMI